MNIRNNIKNKITKRVRRHGRIRARVTGTAKKPRLFVFRSNQHIYAQLIDDQGSKTLAIANDKDLKTKPAKAAAGKTSGKKDEAKELAGKIALAHEVGKMIAKKAKELDIDEVIFDRGGYLYHGRVKSLADGAREEGLKF